MAKKRKKSRIDNLKVKGKTAKERFVNSRNTKKKKGK